MQGYMLASYLSELAGQVVSLLTKTKLEIMLTTIDLVCARERPRF